MLAVLILIDSQLGRTSRNRSAAELEWEPVCLEVPEIRWLDPAPGARSDSPESRLLDPFDPFRDPGNLGSEA